MSKTTDLQKDFNMLVGKQIEMVDVLSVNCITLYMTDGTQFTLETECVIPTLNLYGISVMKEEEKSDLYYSGN